MRSVTAILVLAILTMAAVSCSDNPAVRARYEAEKLYFDAEKLAGSAQVRPDLNPTGLVGEIRNSYGRVVEHCYAALETVNRQEYPLECSELEILAFKASGRLTQLFYLQERFDTCVSICDRLLEKTTLQGVPRASAYLSLGRSLQAAGRWDSAQAVYEYSTETFYPPLEPNGEIMTGLFNLPAQIFQIYARVGDTIAAAIQLDRAEYYYRDLIKEYPNTRLAPASHASLAVLYEQTGRWQRSIEELAAVTDSTGRVAAPARERIADLYADQLKDYDRALAGYDSLVASLEGADTVNLPGLEFKRSMIFVEKQQYPEARQVLNSLKDNHPQYFAENAVAQYAVARTFDLQDNWERAETEFRYLLENYEDSEEAMSTYLYLAGRLTEKGRRIEAQRLEEEAGEAYKRIAAEKAGLPAEATAMTYQAELYRRNNDWPRAAETLGEVFHKFPYTEVGYRSAVAAAAIYRQELDDSRRSDSLVTEIKKRLTAVDEAQ
ncbi:MAG: tetratricopeptide repeat protein [bacterium]|nr:tetratricopeptide repeat protein [bacterium]